MVGRRLILLLARMFLQAKYEEKYQRAKEHHEEEVKQFCKDHPDIVSLPSPIKSKGRVAGGGGPKTSRLTKKDKLLMSMTEEERKQYEVCCGCCSLCRWRCLCLAVHTYVRTYSLKCGLDVLQTCCEGHLCTVEVLPVCV